MRSFKENQGFASLFDSTKNWHRSKTKRSKFQVFKMHLPSAVATNFENPRNKSKFNPTSNSYQISLISILPRMQFSWFGQEEAKQLSLLQWKDSTMSDQTFASLQKNAPFVSYLIPCTIISRNGDNVWQNFAVAWLKGAVQHVFIRSRPFSSGMLFSWRLVTTM